ncbi:MAG: photosystem I reaction center subunit XII [Symploca sp. SIO1C4]|uniref:Photosystem I reaction center subunit XII n=2 Tax=Symploca sp. SIO1C4 TaxID=2607765 RepID=A0A6B3NG89_9CYAN|nr:photosystem I reaction center subunit XII [Symploca sp. SIO1C4]
MSISDTQVFVALVIALIPGILAFRLATELYKYSPNPQIYPTNEER